jgi:hypothetical protein
MIYLPFFLYARDGHKLVVRVNDQICTIVLMKTNSTLFGNDSLPSRVNEAVAGGRAGAVRGGVAVASGRLLDALDSPAK